MIFESKSRLFRGISVRGNKASVSCTERSISIFFVFFFGLNVSDIYLLVSLKSDDSKIAMSTSIPGHVLDASAPDLQQSDPPITSLHLYRRLFQGRKHLFAPSDTSSADYFIENPVPHKHHGSWKPVFYRGDNPKYTPTATVIGRAFRTAMWSSFRLWLGDGVREVLENEARAKAKRKAARKAKCRKVFGLKPKPPKEPLEDEKEVLGKVVVVEMRRGGLFTRKFDWEVDGVQYRWSGTRMFSTGPMKGVKGWTHDLKVRLL
jgi:hypothetical protein